MAEQSTGPTFADLFGVPREEMHAAYQRILTVLGKHVPLDAPTVAALLFVGATTAAKNGVPLPLAMQAVAYCYDPQEGIVAWEKRYKEQS